jgi:hypothetical protein
VSALLDQQLAFGAAFAKLVTEIARRGWGWKPGRGLCCPFCSKETSLHRQSLAEDVLLFKADAMGRWQFCARSEEYVELGAFWKTLHPAARWGGDFDLDGDGRRGDDGNHFSFAWGGHQ